MADALRLLLLVASEICCKAQPSEPLGCFALSNMHENFEPL